jgi:hypothetical protein
MLQSRERNENEARRSRDKKTKLVQKVALIKSETAVGRKESKVV